MNTDMVMTTMTNMTNMAMVTTAMKMKASGMRKILMGMTNTVSMIIMVIMVIMDSMVNMDNMASTASMDMAVMEKTRTGASMEDIMVVSGVLIPTVDDGNKN